MKYRARIIDLIMVSKKLATLDARYAFTGGAVVPLLMDHPELVASRPTKDVDVIVEVVTRIQYTDLEARLRGIIYVVISSPANGAYLTTDEYAVYMPGSLRKRKTEHLTRNAQGNFLNYVRQHAKPCGSCRQMFLKDDDPRRWR